MATEVVRTENLTKIYAGQKIALNGVALAVPKGSVFGFLGPNGAGKTTCLRLLLGLQKPTAGSVEVLGEGVNAGSAALRKRIGYLPTSPQFPPDMTPISYLNFAGKLSGLGREERTPRLASLIRAVGLLGAQSQRIGTFSTGMRTRLGIAASLINDPELLLWDEPCSGLDPTGRRHTIDLIRWLGKTKSVVVSSHILTDIDQVCTHVGVLSEGKLIFSGTMSEMKALIHVDTVAIELAGASAAIDQFAQELPKLECVSGFDREGTRFQISANDGSPLTSIIGRLIEVVQETGPEVLTLTTGWGRMEDAYLSMLEHDDARGFLRAYPSESGGPDGLLPTHNQSAAAPAPTGTALRVDVPNVTVESVKKSEHGNDMVVRLYEADGTQTRATLQVGPPTAFAAVVDPTGEHSIPLEIENGAVQLEFAPYELHTIRLSRLAEGGPEHG